MSHFVRKPALFFFYLTTEKCSRKKLSAAAMKISINTFKKIPKKKLESQRFNSFVCTLRQKKIQN